MTVLLLKYNGSFGWLNKRGLWYLNQYENTNHLALLATFSVQIIRLETWPFSS